MKRIIKKNNKMKSVLFRRAVSSGVLLLCCLFAPAFLHAQLEKVIVETYYVSDANDATDTTARKLPVGSTTYRIYIDLKPGCKLTKIYGNAKHTLKIASDSVFFNQPDSADGNSFGNTINKARLSENTIALDSWLALGQIAKSGSKIYFGIPKTQDTDGSFVGGATNNDGGSAMIPGGLLVNTDPLAGIPLTTSDGYALVPAVPTGWANYGFIDAVSGNDTTIFGWAKPGFQFISTNSGLQNSGVMGVLPDSNQVLVAQLTTLGQL